MNISGHEIKTPAGFFGFKLVHIIMLVPIVAVAISWWTTRESRSAVDKVASVAAIDKIAAANIAAVNLQNILMADHTKRLEGQDKRFDGLDARLLEYSKQQTQNTLDLHEVMTKFRIMVELVDGNGKRPELHK